MGWIVLAVIAALVLAVILLYNRLVLLRNRVDQAWSGIDVQLKRRYDLIPNLVETVKGYAAHERETFERVTEARARAMAADNPQEQAAAENQITGALKSIFALSEAYPDLKASESFLQLQEDLTDTEDKISAARRYYNATVMRFNTMVQTFPWLLFAEPFGFRSREFFSAEGDAAVPEVSFAAPSTP